MKKILLLSTCLLAVNLSFGQSDKNFTHYMSDQISFNPAATGFRGYCGTLLYRNQWMGVDGAPSTFLFNGQANIEDAGMGVGISFMSDRIGFQVENDFKVTAAKHFNIVGAGYFSVGLGVGIINSGFIPAWVTPDGGLFDGGSSPVDPDLPGAVFQSKLDINAGLFWRGEGDKYYIGLSSTHLTQPLLEKVNFEKRRHLYATGGMKIDYSMWSALGSNLTLKPSFLVISDLTTSNIEFTALVDYKFIPDASVYGGVAWRREAIAVLLGLSKEVSNQDNEGLLKGSPDVLNFGLAYDINTTSFNKASNGSLEIWANYCIFPKDKSVSRHGNPFILQ
ncbi:MAG: PorP/SprF family type IX secretion system membrane protein [Crocinitomicaceae bacterium]